MQQGHSRVFQNEQHYNGAISVCLSNRKCFSKHVLHRKSQAVLYSMPIVLFLLLTDLGSLLATFSDDFYSRENSGYSAHLSQKSWESTVKRKGSTVESITEAAGFVNSV